MTDYHKRYDTIFDNQEWVLSNAKRNDLTYTLQSSDIEMYCKKKGFDILDVLRKQFPHVNIKAYVDPTSSIRSTFFLEIPNTLYFSFVVYADGDTACMYQWGYAGDPGLCASIIGAILSLGEERPRSANVYHINVLENYTVTDKDGIHIKVNMHRLSTDKNLLDLKDFLYPGLDVEKFIKTYLSSRENISIFYGPPGTGKTSLMKTLIRKTAELCRSGYNCIYIKDKEVLRQPAFWTGLTSAAKNTASINPNVLLGKCSTPVVAQNVAGSNGDDYAEDDYALEGNNLYLILDDLDDELGARTKGGNNFIVNQLLSFSDGLFENNLKIIVTTNQEISDIDPALIRPGRCMDVLQLLQLTRTQALDIWVNELEMKMEDFETSWPANQNEEYFVSQAALISEYIRVKSLSETKDYLLNPAMSIRKKLLQS